MDPRTKAVKAHRKRLQSRGLRRVEVTVKAEHVGLLRAVAANLRAGYAETKRIKAALEGEAAHGKRSSLAEALYDPIVAGPDFDEAFEQIERSRHDPVMTQMRDVDL